MDKKSINLENIKKSPSYRLAYEDVDFLRKEDLRPLRLQLELLKPEMVMDEHDINSTVVIFGSARIHNNHGGDNVSGPDAKIYGRFYEAARKFTHILGEKPIRVDGEKLIVVTGGGPGIMEAANRGAYEANTPSIGLNITLEHEQEPNPFISPELCFQFQYFAIRKMHFLLRAKVLIAFPGGFGTFDELFEALTLLQTRRMPTMPVYLFGEEFWSKVLNFDALVDAGVVSPHDLQLFNYVESAEELWQRIHDFYESDQ